MRITAESYSLVLAGIWNEALLTPVWVAKYGLGIQEGSVNLKVSDGGPLGPTTFSLPGLSYNVLPNALVLRPETQDHAGLNRVQEIAQAILRELPHTPVGALGLNVGFESTSPSEEVLGSFRVAQNDVVDATASEGWSVAGNKLHTSLSKDGLTLNIDKLISDGNVKIQFNFHSPCSGAVSAIAALDRLPFSVAVDEAMRIAGMVLGEEMSDAH